jgi:hypothetical protein
VENCRTTIFLWNTHCLPATCDAIDQELCIFVPSLRITCLGIMLGQILFEHIYYPYQIPNAINDAYQSMASGSSTLLIRSFNLTKWTNHYGFSHYTSLREGLSAMFEPEVARASGGE